MKAPDRLTIFQWVTLLAGVILLGSWAEISLSARSYQRHARGVLDRAQSHDGSGVSRVSTSGASIERAVRARDQARSTGVVGRLEIPRLGLSAMVGEGINSHTLGRAIGHVPGSAFPGESGNVSLAGHRDTYFRKLGGIRRGDTIRLTTPDGEFAYRVVSTRVVGPRTVSVLRDNGVPSVTLVTCYPFRMIGPAPNRFVVRAERTPIQQASKSLRASG